MLQIGIDLGGTNVKGVLLTETGEVLASETLPGTGGGAEWKGVVKRVFIRLRDIAGSPVVAGLAAPGLPDEHNEKIVYMPGRLDGLEGLNWSEFLGQHIVVLNDAHSALVAEATWGAAKGLKHVVLLTLGTGVGGAILIDGKLYQGMYQRAGSLGDISLDADSPIIGLSGMPGSLEDSIGNDTVGHRSGGKFNSTRTLVEAAFAGDSEAMEIWKKSLRKLAVGICSLINILSPEAVILGGGIAQSGDRLFKSLEEYISRYEMRPLGKSTPILPARFSEYSGAIGAACFALEKSELAGR